MNRGFVDLPTRRRVRTKQDQQRLRNDETEQNVVDLPTRRQVRTKTARIQQRLGNDEMGRDSVDLPTRRRVQTKPARIQQRLGNDEIARGFEDLPTRRRVRTKPDKQQLRNDEIERDSVDLPTRRRVQTKPARIQQRLGNDEIARGFEDLPTRRRVRTKPDKQQLRNDEIERDSVDLPTRRRVQTKPARIQQRLGNDETARGFEDLSTRRRVRDKTARLGNDEMERDFVDLPAILKFATKKVRIQQRLGNGAFGVVYKVKDEASYAVYALKDGLCLNDSALRNAVREATTLDKISHQNVIAIVGAGQLRDSKCFKHMLLLTEYCSGGSLNDRLARPSSEEMNMKWIYQTAAALAHLHSRGVVHRDLKADNVLLTATEDVKLADFGLARDYIALKRIDTQRDDDSWITSYTRYYLNSGVGPVHWVAPEFFTGHYTEKADVFSLGTLFFAILERDFIMVGGKAIYGAFVNIPGVGKLGLGLAMANVDRRVGIMFSSHAHEPRLRRVVVKALQYDSKTRPSAQEVCDKVMNIYQAMIWRLQDHQRQFRFNSSHSSNSSADTIISSRSSYNTDFSNISHSCSRTDSSNSSEVDSTDSIPVLIMIILILAMVAHSTNSILIQIISIIIICFLVFIILSIVTQDTH